MILNLLILKNFPYVHFLVYCPIASVHEIESNKSLAEVTVDVELKNEFAVDMSYILSVSVKLTIGRSDLVPMKIYVECNTAYSEKITKESRTA